MVLLVDNDTHDPTEKLIGLLQALAEDTTRLDALYTLNALPDSFWAQEFIEGAVAALAPVAEIIPDDDDDDVGFALWTLLASLLSKLDRLNPSETNAAAQFCDMIGGILNVNSGQLRGFAAGIIAQANIPEADQLLLDALTKERRWDVAIRIITGLSLRGAAAPLKSLISLLEAPTDEATTWAARQIGEQRDHLGRVPLFKSLHADPPPSLPLRDALEDALKMLNTDDARLYSLDGPLGELRDIDGKHAGFSFSFDPVSSSFAHATAPVLDVRLRLPIDDDKAAAARVRRFAALLAQSAAVPLAETTHTTPSLLDSWTPSSPVTASAPFRVGFSDGQHTISLSLEGQSPLLWLRTLTPMLASVRQTILILNSRTRPSVDLTEAALDALQENLQERSRRHISLSESFTGSYKVQADDGNTYMIVACNAEDFFIAFDLGELTTNTPEAGGLLVISPPSDEQSTSQPVIDTLCDRLTWKFGVAVSPLTGQKSNIKMRGNLTQNNTITFKTASLNPDSESDVQDLIKLLSGLHHYLENTFALLKSDVPFWELLGLSEPELRERLPIPKPEALEPSSLPSLSSTNPLPHKAATTAPSDLWADIGGFKAPGFIAPVAITPSSAVRQAQARHSASKEVEVKPSAAPSEVIKNLDAGIELADVYLRTSGYNHRKLAQIMTILLDMEPDEAMKLIEQTPCILRSGVPRDRARTIRRVLEGTGAKITVTKHGESA